MGCSTSNWKREVVEEHKWGYVDVREFHSNSIFTRLRYALVYGFIFKNFAIYCLDIFTATTMLATDNWTSAIYAKCTQGGTVKCNVDVKFGIAKWVFVGCIILSLVLLLYESYWAYKVYLTQDIALTFSNLMTFDYFSVKKYDNFCLFCKISKQKKKTDKLAFFIYFTFKDWKRVIACDGPRQSINAVILWNILKVYNFETNHMSDYWDGNPWTLMLLLAMITTVFIFIFSLGLMIIAAVCYVPLRCYIAGSLQEYIWHKVDKRIDDIIRKYQRRRIKQNADIELKIAKGVPVMNSKGEYVDSRLLQPTLPSISLEDPKPMRTASPAFGRTASPAFGRTASPAFGRSPTPHGRHSPDHSYAEKVYVEDVYDVYSTDGHSTDHSTFRMYEEYSSSKVGLLSAAAPPGRAPTPGAPSYPPRAAPYVPSYPPSSSPYPPSAPRPYEPSPGYNSYQQHGW